MKEKKIFIFSGEPSGDLHGSRLIKELHRLDPSIEIHGVGGPKMRSEKFNCFMQMEQFEVMGFTDVLRALPSLVKNFYLLKNHLITQKPSAIIFIDYPGFNLRLAKALRKETFNGKIIHYISPSVWAHGQGRIKQMAQTLDGLLTIFPFEAQHFSNTSLKVDYVGNPLQEYISDHRYDENWKSSHGIEETAPLLSLFPGSRQGEIERNLPAMLHAAEMLQRKYGELAITISCTNERSKEKILASLKLHSLNAVLIPRTHAYEMMKDSRLAIAKSGTVTLELALHECPTVVVYNATALNRWIAKNILRLKMKHYCIVNILKDCTVFPEFIEKDFSSQNIFEQASLLYSSESIRSECQKKCREIKTLLSHEKPSRVAAQKIMELVKC